MISIEGNGFSFCRRRKAGTRGRLLGDEQLRSSCFLDSPVREDLDLSVSATVHVSVWIAELMDSYLYCGARLAFVEINHPVFAVTNLEEMF